MFKHKIECILKSINENKNAKYASKSHVYSYLNTLPFFLYINVVKKLNVKIVKRKVIITKSSQPVLRMSLHLIHRLV